MTAARLIIALLLSLGGCVPVSNNAKRQDAAFDYVIVGGGTAGLTLAARLSEDPSTSVAVIEAGTYYSITDPLLASTPAGDTLFAGSSPTDTNPLVDWDFVTTPQTGANNRPIRYPRGKCLGGSSALNFMIYQRPDTGSMQLWADAVGDQSYTFENMLPYYKKSVQFTPPDTNLRDPNATTQYDASAFDSAGGPLRVSYANYAQPFSSYLQPAMQEIGIAAAKDFNSGTVMGSQYCSSTINPYNENRDSSQTSFLSAAESRPNLHIYHSTKASKVLFDGSKAATGVLLDSNSTLSANKEVILSAGAFQTPQLLMLSGIGPAETLERFDISVLADRPGVGQNLTDHIFFGPSYRVNVQTLTYLANNLLYVTEQYATAFLPFKEGPLTNPVCDFLGWEKAPRAAITPSAAAALGQLPDSWPEIEYLTAPGYVGAFTNLFLTQPNDGYQYATILAALVAPQSRGTVTISSSDVNDLPVVDPAWLTDPTDQSVAVAAYKRTRQAFASDAMQPVLADATEYFPGPSVQSDEQILNTVRDTLMTVYHASCTARMGAADDPAAVVDSSARVIGVQRLRVVDASSFALLPPGHPQSTVYAFAEKVADEIKAGR
ncbi:hypothetical protein N8I77_011331 [Diaporthe amygdali]|uniref:Glucose-methanol-choline oxidoreductase N-terminal domain-containing protein n=1 Tax=Phomopsis amygdali TaxID=1214568 RepID=A0AAD9S6P7_PHOAM|nr:hypothetical protein N8I77_011331 [Diaporthe amygdali]